MTLCGYCERPLVRVGDRYECPSCAPTLRTLGAGLPFDGAVAAYQEFQREAWRTRPKVK